MPTKTSKKVSRSAVEKHHELVKRQIEALLKKNGFNEFIVTTRHDDNSGFTLMEGSGLFFLVAQSKISSAMVGL